MIILKSYILLEKWYYVNSSELKSSASGDVILELKNISKVFPGVKALDNVSLKVNKGEILAILGENGAGKSTLMKILSGLYQPDQGELWINPSFFNVESRGGQKLQRISINDTRMSMRIGIGMVYQHFQLVQRLSVAENITMGREFTKKNSIIIDKEKTKKHIEQLGKNFGLPIDPTAIVENLPVGLKQRTEILKQLYRDTDLLILDEPTAVLTPTEVEGLFDTMRSLKNSGRSLIFISHKLHEPLKIADRIIVIRKGKVVGEIKPEKASKEILAEMVVGRKIKQQYQRQKFDIPYPILSVDYLTVKDPFEERNIVDNISFKVNEHEILGIAGVQGNGQTELVEALIGIREIDRGKITFFKNGGSENITYKSTIDRLKMGISYIPEDREKRGIIEGFDVKENVWLAFQGHVESMMLPFEQMNNLTKTIIDEYEIMTPSITTPISSLSGGNQQKVIIGREFAKDPRLIIASEPTRGVDIGVMEKVHRELIEKRDAGVGILLISSDLDEILTLSDRILVMYEGKIAGGGKADDISIEEISHLMTTGKYTKGGK